MEANKEMEAALERDGVYLYRDVYEDSDGHYYYAVFLALDSEGDLVYAEKEFDPDSWKGPNESRGYITDFRRHRKINDRNLSSATQSLDIRDGQLSKEITTLEAKIAKLKEKQALIAYVKQKLG